MFELNNWKCKPRRSRGSERIYRMVPTSTSAYSILVTLEALRPQRFIQYKLFYKLSQDLQRLID